jgi:5-methylcytosine-specific restriction endonuclease McrA
MKFELEPHNRNVPESELIADLKRVANELQKNSVSCNEYDTRGRFSSSTLANRLGSWSKATEKAGLAKSPTSIKKISDEQLLDDLKLVAEQIQKPSVTRDEYEERGQFAPANFRKRFGSWNKALDKAGLQRTISFDTTEEELFTNLVEIWMKLERQPKMADLTSKTSKFSHATYVKRFGTWRKALEAFVVWANKGETQAIEASPQKEDFLQKSSTAQSQTRPSPKQEVFRHRTSRTINYRLRFLVMRRDNFKCKITGRSPATDPTVILEVDHIVPWDKDGETVMENLQTLAKEINIGKSNLDMYQKD